MRVFFNEDFLHFFWTRYENDIDVDESVLRDFIKQYKNSSITDFLLNINGTVSSSPSKILETMLDRYVKSEEEGKIVNFKNTFASQYHKIFNEKNLDAYGIWIDELKNIGINPWLSFRMNDCHYNMESEPHFVRSEFVNSHPEYWISGNRKAIGYFDKLMNYLIPEIQNRMLSYIEEQLLRYDVYGIELDFMREFFCFPEGMAEQGRSVALSFFEKVKDITLRIGKQRGKSIKISMTCQASPISAYNCGFDIAELSNRGLVDFVMPGPRWDSINTDIPVAIWKKLLDKNTKLGCIQQLLVAPKMGWNCIMSTKDMAFGQAAAFKSLGADVIYLYNYFDTIESGLNKCYHDTSVRTRENIDYIINNIGKIDDISGFDRCCPLTFDDSIPLFESHYSRLPLLVDGGEFKQLRIVVGAIEENQKAFLNIQFKNSVNTESLEIYCNNIKADFLEQGLEDKNITDKNVYTFEIKPWLGNDVVLAVNSLEECIIEYAEILVKKL